MRSSDLSREQGLLITGSLVLLATVALSFALSWGSRVLIPLFLAFLVVYLVAPVVDLLQVRLGAPRWLAIFFAFVVIGLGTTGLTLLVWSSINGLADEMPRYRESLTNLGHELVGLVELLPDYIRPDGLGADHIDPEALLGNLNLESLLTTLGTGATNLVGVLTNLLWNAVLVVLFSVIIIAGRKPLQEHSGLRGEIDRRVQKYLVTKFTMSALTGTLTWLVLTVLGVPLALMFGVFAFVLNFIPSVGSLLAMLLPLPIALVHFPDSPLMWVLVVALPGLVQFGIGNVLEPRVLGDSLDLHPITILLTLIFWALLWGVVGALISVPVTAVVKIILERYETTRPAAEILAGRFG
ncbi:MAG: AI-2E family transporter [Myxococcales bacterium]|nr:AI-2E family transporter [Myxococcales bacterium]